MSLKEFIALMPPSLRPEIPENPDNKSLQEFLAFLHGRGLIDATTLVAPPNGGLRNMFRAQKYVYLARYFGLDLGYRNDVHLRLLYSARMSKDCEDIDFANIAPGPAPAGLREADFLSAVSGKRPGWLDVAASIVMNEELDGDIRLEHVVDAKTEYAPEFVRSVYEDVHRTILPPAVAA